MTTLAVIGNQDKSIDYIDRPTVKVLVYDSADKVLILNDGLLPGGGIEKNETIEEALARELKEELGISVNKPAYIGDVIQYRTLLAKKYIIHGYQAEYFDIITMPDPQDEGEKNFKSEWMAIDQALELIAYSIEKLHYETFSFDSDTTIGKLYNLMTTKVLLENIT